MGSRKPTGERILRPRLHNKCCAWQSFSSHTFVSRHGDAFTLVLQLRCLTITDRRKHFFPVSCLLNGENLLYLYKKLWVWKQPSFCINDINKRCPFKKCSI